MRDHIIRAAFHQDVLKKEHLDHHTFVVDELGLKNGGIRADIAVLNGSLVGYEIKTEKDNLYRLPAQIEAYNEVFDKAHIITGQRHLSKIEAMLPAWWGIYLIESGQDQHYRFACHRPACQNKSKSTFGIAQLLWKKEATEIIANNLKLKVSQKSRKEDLYNQLAEAFPADILGGITLQYMKSREDWRTGPLPRA